MVDVLSSTLRLYREAMRATGREVRVPLAVIYDMKDGLIVRGRVYFEVPAFLAQVAQVAQVAPAASAAEVARG